MKKPIAIFFLALTAVFLMASGCRPYQRGIGIVYSGVVTVIGNGSDDTVANITGNVNFTDDGPRCALNKYPFSLLFTLIYFWAY